MREKISAVKSMKFKLIVAFFFTMLISLAVVNSISLNYSSRIIDSNVDQNLKYLSNYVTHTVEFFIKDVDSIIHQLYLDQRIIQLVGNKAINGNEYGKYVKRNEINGKLQKIILSTPHITRILISSRKQEIYCAGRGSIPDIESLKREIWYSKIVEGGLSENIGIEYYKIEGIKEIPVISITRKIVDISTEEIIGYINVYLNYEEIDKVINDNKLANSHKFYILDDSKKLLYPKRDEQLLKSILYGRENEGCMVTSVFSNVTGLNFMSIVPKDELTKDFNNIKLSMSIFVVVIIIVQFIMIFIISGYFTRPLRKLTVIMKKVKSGDLNVSIQKTTNDEVGVLCDVFNSMMETIKKLLLEVKTKEKERTDAELTALQSQINPHFIYHTLNTILWISKINKIDSIQKIAVSLIGLLKTSIGNRSRLITVEEEVEYAKNYIQIENFRFKEEIKLKCRVDEDVKSLKTLKLILQPLVENAIHHGFEEKNFSAVIDISVFTAEQRLVMEIRDNGKGMSKEVIQCIMENRVHNTRFTGIGMKNVRDRIRLNFGGMFDIRIDSMIDNGTLVRIEQPIMR